MVSIKVRTYDQYHKLVSIGFHTGKKFTPIYSFICHHSLSLSQSPQILLAVNELYNSISNWK